MARVQLFEGGNIAPAQATNARYQAPDFGPGIGRGLEELGNAGGEAAHVLDHVGQIHDEASVKDITNGIVNDYISNAYTSDNAFFKQQGRAAMDAAPQFDKSLEDQIKSARLTLQNERQRHMFDDAMQPQMQTWAIQRGTYLNRETLQYGVDQSKSRSETAINAGTAMFETDPAAGTAQLNTALGEVDSQGRLLGWSKEQVDEAKQETSSKFYSSIATNLAVRDPIEAWNFTEAYKDEIGFARLTELQTTLRPRYLRQQGVDLADRLSGAAPPKAADGSSVDPLAPVSDHKVSADNVWARMVGPDGKGGLEGGTNSDGSFRISPKGALGPAQVMPGTAREAAAAAGLPYDEQKYKTDAAYNLAIGRGYFNKQLAKFGDPVLAAAAYNAGPGTVAAALRKGGADNWMDHLPAETKKYVAGVGGAGHIPSSSGASPELALASQLKTLEGMDLPYEVKEAARSELTQRAQVNSLVAKQEHSDWLNSFELSLHDGTAGTADIAAARKTGKLTDYDEIARAEGIVKDREKSTEDLTNFGKMMGDPHFVFNQYDDTQKKAVEAGVAAQGGSPQAAFNVWTRTGILAKSGSVALRGALVSTDPNAIRTAANIAGNMLRRNPNAFAGVDGGSDIEHSAVAFNHYVYDLGMAPAAAAQRVAQENDPKFKEKVKYTDPERQDAMKQLRQNGGVQAATVFKGAAFPNVEAQGEANQTFHEMITDNLAKGMDLGSAMAQAGAQLRKVYGVNARGRIVKYAPEASYPAIGGSYAYIYKDAEETVKKETGRTPVSVNLVPIPGVTDEDFRNGHPARYRLLYSYMEHGQKIVDSVSGQFAADTVRPAKELSTSRRRSFAQERTAMLKQSKGSGATVPDYSLPEPSGKSAVYFSPGGKP